MRSPRAVGVIVLTAFAVGVSGCGQLIAPASSTASSPGASTPSAAPSTSPPKGTRTVAVADGPIGVASDGTAVWVVSGDANTVSRIDPTNVDITETVSAGATPLRVAVGLGAGWVTSFREGALLRIDPTTAKVTGSVAIGKGAEGVTTGFGSVWVIAQDAGELVRVDPRTLQVIARFDVGAGARLALAGPDRIYVSHYARNELLAIDPKTKVTQRADLPCSGPQGMALSEGAVWVACTLDSVVLAVDAATLTVRHTVPVEGSPDTVVVAQGRPVVIAEDGPTVVILDPTTGAVGKRLPLSDAAPLGDRANLDAVVVGDTVWVSSYREGMVYAVPLPF